MESVFTDSRIIAQLKLVLSCVKLDSLNYNAIHFKLHLH